MSDEADAFAAFYGLLLAEACNVCGQINGQHFNDCTTGDHQ